MSEATEFIIDRRRLRRKLTFWRVATFVFLAGLIIALVRVSGVGDEFGAKRADHIARVKISGVIINDQKLLDLFDKLQGNDRVKAVVLDISSPGGSTVGGEATFEAVRALADKKPVAASVGTLAASAAYMIAAGSDHIVARRSSIVGSIGVIFQYADASRLLDKIGLSVEEIKSSPLKAEPSPFHPASEEAKAMIDSLVRDTYQWFVDLVAERRQLSAAQALRLADGSIFSGAQGLDNGLIDAIGSEQTAIDWLASEHGVDADLDVVTWEPERTNRPLVANPAALAGLAKLLGVELTPADLRQLRENPPHRLFLDGLVSLWLTSPELLEGTDR